MPLKPIKLHKPGNKTSGSAMQPQAEGKSTAVKSVVLKKINSTPIKISKVVTKNTTSSTSNGMKLKGPNASSSVLKSKTSISISLNGKSSNSTSMKIKKPSSSVLITKEIKSTVLKSATSTPTVSKPKASSSTGLKTKKSNLTTMQGKKPNSKSLKLKIIKNMSSTASSSYRIPKPTARKNIASSSKTKVRTPSPPNIDSNQQNTGSASTTGDHVPQYHWRGRPSTQSINKSRAATRATDALEELDLAPILLLPERVRTKIFEYLTLQERRSTQAVCRTFRNEIRTYVGLGTKLSDNTCGGLVFMRDIAITSIFVTNYKFPILPPSEVIGNACKVQQLTFTEPIAFQHIDAFLSKCRRIQGLFFQAPPLDITPPKCIQQQHKLNAVDYSLNVLPHLEWRSNDMILKSPAKLEYLHTLSLSIPGNRGASLLWRMLQMVNAPNLRKVAIQVGGENDLVNSGTFHMRIFSFLAKQESLKQLLISTVAREEVPNYKSDDRLLGFAKSRITAIAKLMQLAELTLTEAQVNFENWIIFLKEQHSLIVYQILHLMPLSVHRLNIKRNFSTLRVLTIHTEPEEFDLTLVGKCSLLEELYICFPKSEKKSSLVNLTALPATIRVLALKGCSYKVVELFRLIQNLKGLQSLGLVSHGIETDILLKYAHFLYLLRRRNLDELLILGYISTPIEIERFEEHLKSMKIRRLGARRGIHIPHKIYHRRRWTFAPFSFMLHSTWINPIPFYNNVV